MTRLRHFDYAGTARFITFGCYRNLPFLTNDLPKRLLIEELDRCRVKHGFRQYGYVVMPDDVHLVLHPPVVPVKRGLVLERGDWFWSSYGCYQGVNEVPLEVDRLEL